jgi:hypothetical protein
MTRITETVFMERAPVVDREHGTISGVKLCGWDSKNNRHYLPKARESAVRKYVGVKNYVNHDPDGGVERGMEEWASVVTEAHQESDGIYGALQMRTKSPHYEPLMEAAEKFPKQFGMSHVAEGESHFEGEKELVEDISEVLSIDFVPSPATTKGLFESRRKKTKPTVKQAVESLPDGAVRKRIIEMIDSGYIDGDLSMEKDEQPADPLTQMSGLVKELITMLGETLKALAMKKDTPPPAPVVPVEDPDKEDEFEPDEEPEMDPDQKKKKDAEVAAFESVKRENAELKAKNLLLESGRDATASRIKALASADEADRAELLESWPQLEEGERPARSPALIDSQATASPERITEAFAALAR